MFKRNTRVPVDQMKPLEKAAYEVGVDCFGLSCDTPSCGYSDMTIPIDAYAGHLSSKCPDCGSHLLTQQDFLQVMAIVFSSAAQCQDHKSKH